MSNRLSQNYNRRDILKFGGAAAVGAVVLTACGESQSSHVDTGSNNIDPDTQENVDLGATNSENDTSLLEQDTQYVGVESLNPEKYFGLPEEEIREIFSLHKGIDPITGENFEALTDSELIEAFVERMNIVANLARSEQYLQESEELGYEEGPVGYSQYAMEKYINPALDGGLFTFGMEGNDGVYYDSTRPIRDLMDLLGDSVGIYYDVIYTVENLGRKYVSEEIINDIPGFTIDSSGPLSVDGFDRGYFINYTFNCKAFAYSLEYKGVIELGVDDTGDKYEIMLSRFSKKSQN